MQIRYDSLPVWPYPPSNREGSRFTASWPDTLNLLDRELSLLGTEYVTIQAGFQAGAIRLDGYPRADAKTHHPGVIISFDSKYGPLRYGTDRFGDSRYWKDGRSGTMPGYQANIRAVALSLEALRMVDRYGVTKTGEQYAGFKALPSGSGLTTVDAARKLIQSWARLPDGEPDQSKLVKAALRNAHPDHGGTDEAFHAVRSAQRMLADLT